nr:hypothetical protein [Oceanobacillus indicireducens]
MYECEDCSGCPLRYLCTQKPKSSNPKVYRKVVISKRICTYEVFRRENW